jgi:hypothetical protein
MFLKSFIRLIVDLKYCVFVSMDYYPLELVPLVKVVLNMRIWFFWFDSTGTMAVKRLRTPTKLNKWVNRWRAGQYYNPFFRVLCGISRSQFIKKESDLTIFLFLYFIGCDCAHSFIDYMGIPDVGILRRHYFLIFYYANSLLKTYYFRCESAPNGLEEIFGTKSTLKEE